jgi:hypothetical protein
MRTSPGIWSIILKNASVFSNRIVGVFSPGEVEVHVTDLRLDIWNNRCGGVRENRERPRRKQKRDREVGGKKKRERGIMRRENRTACRTNALLHVGLTMSAKRTGIY